MKNKRIDRTLHRYGDRILNRPEFDQAMQQTHHKKTTVGKHTLNVAAAAIGICFLLEKIRIHVKKEDVVVGALCHDLGILGRKEKFSSNRECFRNHADASVETARKILPELNENTEGIIRTHMWPMAGRHPKSREAVIVSAADKIASIRDWIEN